MMSAWFMFSIISGVATHVISSNQLVGAWSSLVFSYGEFTWDTHIRTYIHTIHMHIYIHIYNWIRVNNGHSQHSVKRLLACRSARLIVWEWINNLFKNLFHMWLLTQLNSLVFILTHMFYHKCILLLAVLCVRVSSFSKWLKQLFLDVDGYIR